MSHTQSEIRVLHPRSKSRFVADGRELTFEQQKKLFEQLYPNKAAIRNIWPHMSERNINYRISRWVTAINPGNSYEAWEDKILRDLHPNFAEIGKQLPHRTRSSLQNRCQKIRLTKPSVKRKWTAAEDDLLRCGLAVPGKSPKAIEHRRARLNLTLRKIKQTRALTGRDLYALVVSVVPRSLPKQVRDEVEANIVLACLSGDLETTAEAVRGAIKKQVTAVYKLHPDRGAPVSMDAKLFDDGESTVGDRIAADAFHF